MAKRVSQKEQLATAEKNIRALRSVLVAKENVVRQLEDERNSLRSEVIALLVVRGDSEQLTAALEQARVELGEAQKELALAQKEKWDWKLLCQEMGDRVGVDLGEYDDPEVIGHWLDEIWGNWELKHKSRARKEQVALLRDLIVKITKNK